MAVTHAYSSPIADATGTQTIWYGATTATVAATDNIRPSNWNEAHAQLVTLAGNTAGVSVVTGTNIVFGGSNNVTLSGIQGANAGTINISAAAGGGGGSVNISAGTTSNNLTNFVFANSNGVSFGLNGSTVTATVQTNYLTTAQPVGAYLTTARASNDAVGLNTAQSNVTWTVNSSGLSLDARGYAGSGYTSTTTAGTAIVGTHNSAGLSLGVPAFLTTAQPVGAYLTTARASNDAVGLNSAGTNVTWTVNSSGISINASGYAGSGFTSTTTAGTAVVGTHNSVGLSMAFPSFITNAITTARASTDAIGLNTAQSNVTWTVNSSGLSLDARGYAGTGTTFNGANVSGSITLNSAGLQLSLSGATAAPSPVNISAGTTSNNLASIVFSNSNGVSFGLNGSTVTASVAAGAGGGIGAGVSNLGNTAGSTGTVTTGNVVFVGSNGITLSQSTGAAGSAATITILGFGNKETISSWQHPIQINSSSAMAGQSVSMAAAFMMPQDGSFSFMRLPVSMSTNSTTIATVATANANMSAELYSTWNAVVYSLGTGASSKSLISVVSGSGGFTFRNSISITNSTQYSVTQGFSAQAQGAGTTLTTQYSISNTNWSLVSTAIQTAFSAARYIDLPFANSLTPGPYWVVFGFSTSSATNNASFTAGTQCNVRFTAVYGATQSNLVWGVMGSTNLTTGGLAGVGSFSTAGGGTTSGFDISFISSNASNFIPAFMLLRSA